MTTKKTQQDNDVNESRSNAEATKGGFSNLHPPSFSLTANSSSSIAQLKDAHGHHEKEAIPTEQKDSSARFSGDNDLNEVESGKDPVKKGDKGVNVTKLQQALIDMGYFLPKYGVDGKFGKETKEALQKYQHDAKIPESGKFDKATLEALDKRFDTRSDYIDAAEDFDPKKPNAGSRALSPDDKKNAMEALKPQTASKGATFDSKDSAAYAKDIKDRLSVLIPSLHKRLYADKKPLRADPKKNFYEDATLEGAANAGKEVTDKLYGDLNDGPAFSMGSNLIDQWSDEEERNEKTKKKFKGDAAGMAAAFKSKAKGKVEYLIHANCGKINRKYNASPSGADEKTALAPVIESFIDTEAEVQIMLDIETAWKGAQLDGVQYLQLYKEKTDEENRKRLWEMFHVSIHEYIHTLAAPKYKAWAESLGGSEEHTLIEGFCDFFTLNVRAKFPEGSLAAYQKKVEGPFYDPKAKVPSESDLRLGVYSSNAEAERMVGIIGISNAQLGYFRGAIHLMGK